MDCAVTPTADTPPALENRIFTAGTPDHPMHVQCVRGPVGAGGRLPLVMLHGGFHTGQAYLQGPDGRPGWAECFARRGHAVYVPDWPAHGRSPGFERLPELGTLDIARSIAALLEQIGPAIVLAHSAAGPIAWWLSEHLDKRVVAVLGIAPGSPANLLPDLPDDPEAIARLQHDADAGYPVYSPPGAPVTVDLSFIRAYWANSPRFPGQALAAYAQTIVPESPRLLNERFNIGGQGLRLAAPERVGQRPILIVTGEHDLRHPRATDEALARYLGADYLWLPDAGIQGNGHMLMLEHNSDEIAGLLIGWLEGQGL